MDKDRLEIGRRDAIRDLIYVVGGLSTISTLGCSKILLGTGKILFGDPKLPSEFTTLTKEDLTKGTKKVLVVCSTAESVDDEVSNLRLDLMDGIARKLKLNGVSIIDPKSVADWVDAHDGSVADPQDIAQEFETDYILWIEVISFWLHEPNSHKLLRGHTSGHIRGYKVLENDDDQRTAYRIYTTDFSLTYPEHQPISGEGRSITVFQRDYVSYLCDLLSERFYDHRPGTHI